MANAFGNPLGFRRVIPGMTETDADLLGAFAARRLIARREADVARKAEWPRSTQEFTEKLAPFATGTPWFHELWYAAYDDPTLSKIYVQGPREHAKSSTVLRYVTRRLCEDKHIRVGLISGTDPLAMNFLREVRSQLENNQSLHEMYGGPFRGDRWTDHELVLRGARRGPGAIGGKDVSLFAVGRGGQVSSRHCDVLIIDDVESKDSVKTDTARADTKAWYAKEAVPVLSPGGKLIVIGTRKHFDDLYSTILPPSDAGFTILDMAKSVWTDEGEPIWPEFWDREALLLRKAQMDAADVLAWPQEYLNNPLPSSTQMFRPEEWPAYTTRPRSLQVFQYWDLAISEKTSADWTVGFTIGVDDDANVYLLEMRRGHFDFNRTLGEIEDMGNAWVDHGLITIGIEDVAYQAAAVEEARRRTMLPIVPVKVDKDKVTRARLLEARAAGHKVLRPAESLWWPTFAQEAAYFPLAAHDDMVDSLSGAVRLAGPAATVVGFTYGVWTCTGCAHMFIFGPGRPCPKCGKPCPQDFPNPEEGMAAGKGGLTPAQYTIMGILERGELQQNNVDREDLLTLAAWYIDNDQAVKAQIALSEVARLDAIHRNGVKA